MNTLRNIRPLIDAHMLVVTALALIATALCERFNVVADLPADVLGIGVIFPVVFSIAEAHSRREEALRSFASFKANAIALYLAHRDWPIEPYDRTPEGAQLVRQLLVRFNAYFKAPATEEPAAMRAIYETVGEISVSHRKLMYSGVQPSELSRVSQFLREIVSDFERMRNFAHYRTPISLRAFSRLFLTSFPILFAPYFVFLGQSTYWWLAYAVATIYCIVLVGLDNVQEQLENPYDGIGPDDLHLDVLDEYTFIVRPDDRPAHARLADEEALAASGRLKV